MLPLIHEFRNYSASSTPMGHFFAQILRKFTYCLDFSHEILIFAYFYNLRKITPVFSSPL